MSKAEVKDQGVEQTIQAAEELSDDLKKKRRADIEALAKAQGIMANDKLLNASEREIEELEALVRGVKWAAENPDLFTDPLKAIQSMPTEVTLSKVAGATTTIKSSVTLFDEYIVNVARKSYDNLMKIKNDPESTNFDFFKGCIQCAVDMFFGIKAFRKKAQEEHPGLIAVEVLFAKQLAPVYAIATLFSTILDLCGYKDNTAELIKGGKELKEEAEKAQKAAKEIEQGLGVSIKGLSKAYDSLNEAGILDAVAAVASKTKTIAEVATDIKGLNNPTKEKAIEAIQKMADVVLEMPKSKKDVDEFIESIVPNSEELSGKQKTAFEALKTGLMAIKDDISPAGRVAPTAMALQKFVRDFSKAGGKISEPFKELASKIIAAHDTVVKKDRSPEGAVINKAAAEFGSHALKAATDALARSMPAAALSVARS